MNRHHIRYSLLFTALAFSASCVQDEPEEHQQISSAANTLQCSEGEIAIDRRGLPEGNQLCVPSECHGRAKRSGSLAGCVEAPEKPEVSVKLTNFAKPTPTNKFALQTADNQTKFEQLTRGAPGLYPDTDYDWSFTVEVQLADLLDTDDTNLDFKVWIEDAFQYTPTKQALRGFRCVATGFRIDKNTPFTELNGIRRYNISYSAPLSNDCEIKGWDLSRSNVMREAGISGTDNDTFDVLSRYLFSALHVSYDVDGETVWHKDLATQDELFEKEPECAPNPTWFFYDARSKTYKLSEFYKQRKTGGNQIVYIPTSKTGRFAQLGPSSIKSREDVTIRVNSRVNQPITIDYEYYISNLNSSHKFNPFNPTNEKGESVQAGKAWYTNNLETGNYAPDELVANFYLVPSDTMIQGRLEDYKIATRSLSPSDETTTISDTVQVPVTRAFKNRFTDPSKTTYIDGDQRAFTLFYCLESKSSKTSQFSAFSYRNNNAVAPTIDMSTVMLAQWKSNGEPIFDSKDDIPSSWILDRIQLDVSPLELRARHYRALDNPSIPDPGTQLPINTVRDAAINFEPGCRRDPRPLIINMDRFISPVEPIVAAPYQGNVDAKQTGDSQYGGGNNSVHDIECEKVAPGSTGDDRRDNNDCDEMLQIGGRSDGSDTRSLYTIQSNTTRGRTAGKREVSAGIQGEFLGYQLIDQEDDDTNPFRNEPEGPQPEITFTIQPPWDAIVVLLDQNPPTGPVETDWNVEQDGIGYKLGIKIPFQIGPVPVVVIISFTIGANLSVELTYRFQPEDDDEYPCLNKEKNCVILSEENASFEDASEECQNKGGRLAEMSTQAEYDNLQELKIDENGENVELPDELWVGGQAAFRIDDVDCVGGAANTSECKENQTTEVRWVSNSAAIARSDGLGDFDTKAWTTQDIGPTLDLALPKSGNDNVPFFPNEKALVYSFDDDTLTAANIGEQKPYMCVYDAASDDDFHKFTVATPLGVSAGMSIEGCVPNPLNLFCLGASISFIEFKLTPSFSYIIHNLERTVGGVMQRSARNFVKLDGKFEITLLAAEFAGTLQLLEWLTLKWVIAKYDGIALPEQTLYDEVYPSIGGWE